MLYTRTAVFIMNTVNSVGASSISEYINKKIIYIYTIDYYTKIKWNELKKSLFILRGVGERQREKRQNPKKALCPQLSACSLKRGSVS